MPEISFVVGQILGETARLSAERPALVLEDEPAPTYRNSHSRTNGYAIGIVELLREGYGAHPSSMHGPS